MDMKKRLEKEKEAMLLHKYLESEKAGRDLGEPCMVQWAKDYGEAWSVGYNLENLMDLGDGKKPVYFGVFLDETSRKLLVDSMFELVPSGWDMLCHHCTLAFGDPSGDPEVTEYIARNLGKSVELDVVALGQSDEAMAVRVDGDIRTRNAIPHITVAVPPKGKPVKSNLIERWEDFSLGYKLKGVVDSFPSHFKCRK